MSLSDSKKRITIKDVAYAAGVSTQTVSRVINNVSYVSAETRQRVESVIEKLGYRPSILARNLSQQRSYTLGVVVFGLQYVGPSQALNGIANAAEKLNYMLLMKVLDDDYDTKNVKSVIDTLISHHVEGIIWAPPEIGESHAWLRDLLDSIPLPITFLAMEPREGLPSISINNYEGAVLAVQHLLDNGRKKIGHISGPLTWWVATERKRGWRDTLEKAGLSVPDHYCAEGDWFPASGGRAFLKLYEACPDMDAVFVANDQMAMSVLREAHRLGIDVPKQIAVSGFDNIAESAFSYPSLTTVFQDQQLIGEMAVRTIVEMIQANHDSLHVVAQSSFIAPTLIIRESSGSFD